VFLLKTTDQSVAASVKALEEQQDRMLVRLHQLQLKVKKLTDDAEPSKNLLRTSDVSTEQLCMTSAFINVQHLELALLLKVTRHFVCCVVE